MMMTADGNIPVIVVSGELGIGLCKLTPYSMYGFGTTADLNTYKRILYGLNTV